MEAVATVAEDLSSAKILSWTPKEIKIIVLLTRN
jgi:hypothetical protein